MDVELGQWAPDQIAPIMAPLLLQAVGVYPRIRGYSPYRQFMQQSSLGSLASTCIGAVSGASMAGSPFSFAADSGHLYGYVGAGPLASLYAIAPGATSRAVYARWEDLVFETHGDDPVISGNVGTVGGPIGMPAVLSPDASKCRAMCVVMRFLVLGNIVGQGANAAIGTVPDGLHWSSYTDPTSWPQVGTLAARSVLSDMQPLKGEYGKVQALFGGRDFGTVLQERCVVRMQYSGYDTVFDFFPVDTTRGCLIPGSTIDYGNLQFWLSNDGFVRFDGQQVTPIGFERIDKWVMADIDRQWSHRWFTGTDLSCGLAAWLYPGQGNVAGIGNRLLLYNWKLDKWTLINVNLEALISLVPPGLSLDQMTGSLDDPAITNLDTWGQSTLQYPPQLAGFDPTHTPGIFNGSPTPGLLETGLAEPAPGFLATVHGLRPVLSGADGTATIAIASLGKVSPLIDGAYGVASGPNGAGMCGQRTTGRYVQAKIQTGGNFGILVGLDVMTQQRGTR